MKKEYVLITVASSVVCTVILLYLSGKVYQNKRENDFVVLYKQLSQSYELKKQLQQKICSAAANVNDTRGNNSQSAARNIQQSKSGNQKQELIKQVKTIGQLRELKEKDLPKGMQISFKQAKVILQTIINTSEPQDSASLPTSNILVWGCGNDSPFWHSLTSGKIVFIEDNLNWINKISKAFPFLTIVKVKYTTKMTPSTFQRYTTSNTFWPDLDIRSLLPDWVVETKWDVFLVDAPCGYAASCPARYQSIYTTYLLKKPPCHIIVDDCERKIEGTFSKMVYGNDHLVGQQKRVLLPNNQCYFYYKI